MLIHDSTATHHGSPSGNHSTATHHGLHPSGNHSTASNHGFPPSGNHSLPNHGSPTSGMPPGVDPFAAVSAAILHEFTQPLSRTTIALLAIFLLFHSLIAGFSLIILIWPQITRQRRAQWLIRKSYIPNQPGEKTCNTPLYLINTGLFMCLVQLLGSLSTIAYVCLQINPSRSLNYALHAQPLIPLGMMYLFEMLAHWIMAHCFLTLGISRDSSYSTDIPSRSITKSLTRWNPSPMFVNVFFACFPICIVVGITGAILRGAAGLGIILSQTRRMLKLLSQGTGTLKQLQAPSATQYQRNVAASNLQRIQAELTAQTHESQSNLVRAIYYQRWSSALYFALVSVTCLVSKLSLRA
ncbi:hypothetical protein VP01_443g5 [Puccinia sorghi]|uniref:Uncharacterized protein n=1 Tax=Puccinia sorghi TaxID=27349 RepID=A0A0L6UQB7_9BASI|nr:hypothetical protein VP01_443g5 [Puccinia sorghi]